MAPTWVFADDRAMMAHDGPMFVCGWREAPTLRQMRALASEGRRAEAGVGPLALINVAFGGVPKFTDDVRAIAAELTRDATLFTRSRAHVVVIPGFIGAAVGSFINTFLLLGRPPRPTKIFRGTPEAAAWTARTSDGPQAVAIEALVESVRVRLYDEAASTAV